MDYESFQDTMFDISAKMNQTFSYYVTPWCKSGLNKFLITKML